MPLRSVLLVDDDDDIRTIGEISLAEVGGLRVFVASNGEDALVIAARERPDLVLLDVMMPHLDGPGTLERLRADPRTADLAVVFLTAKVQRREVERFLSYGALGVVAKPFDPMTLVDELQALVQGSGS